MLAGLAGILLTATSTHAATIAITNEPGHTGFGTGGSNIEGGGARSTHTITNFALNGGNAVVVFFGAEGPNNGSVSLSATYGGQAMTVVQTVGTVDTTDRWQASLAYIINPLVSTGDIVANWVSSSESIIEAIALSNVGGVAGSISADNGNTLNLNYTTSFEGGFVVGAGVNNASSGTAGPNNTGNNLDSILFEGVVSGNFGTIFAYGDAFNAGTYTDTIGGTPNIESGALIAFNPIPEPSAALLGAIGSLLLLRRRRN